LLCDIDQEFATNNIEINSIFLGGGTPSILSPKQLQTILTHIQNKTFLKSDTEITIEANPGTIDLDKCKGFRDISINRISLGVQSFNDQYLKSLGRIHDTKQAQEALANINKAEFNNFNLDLMFGLPEQTLDDALADIETALGFTPPHLSWYLLTLEPDTVFATNPPTLPNNEIIWDIQQAGLTLLQQAGLSQYEVSAYSKENHECRHNINYWQYGDYLGVGAGACGKITTTNNQVKRYKKTENPILYMQTQQDLLAQEELVPPSKIPFEFMLNALRLYKPINISLFNKRTGTTIENIMNKINHAESLGLIEIADNHIITTTHGRNFLNDLLEIFI
jgi:oxygen-independent coproporphyrinogen-3 oxidase